MSEEQVVYGVQKKQKKTATVLLRLTPETMKNLRAKAFADRRRPGEFARVLVEKYVDR